MQNNSSEYLESLLSQAFGICEETIEQLKKECVKVPEAGYFLDVMKEYYAPEKLPQPKIIVFGTDFPMEIIYALTGKPPYWVIGGNRVFTNVSDEYVPRDTDPVTRAALGQLLSMEHWKKRTLVIVPCSSDAQRKIAYFLQKRGWKTVTIWIPAVKDAQAHKCFQHELEYVVGTICCHLKKRYFDRSFAKAVYEIDNIRATIHEFLEEARKNESDMPGPLRMAIMDSFFMAADLKEWHTRT